MISRRAASYASCLTGWGLKFTVPLAVYSTTNSPGYILQAMGQVTILSVQYFVSDNKQTLISLFLLRKPFHKPL